MDRVFRALADPSRRRLPEATVEVRIPDLGVVTVNGIVGSAPATEVLQQLTRFPAASVQLARLPGLRQDPGSLPAR